MATGPGRSRRIVAVDDVRENVELMATIIETACGHTVESFTSPSEAFESIGLARPDALFTDLEMPGMDGFALAGLVKQRYPGLPVTLVTGRVNGIDVEYARRRGVDQIVAKPYRLDTLIAAVGQVDDTLNRSDSIRSLAS